MPSEKTKKRYLWFLRNKYLNHVKSWRFLRLIPLYNSLYFVIYFPLYFRTLINFDMRFSAQIVLNLLEILLATFRGVFTTLSKVRVFRKNI